MGRSHSEQEGNRREGPVGVEYCNEEMMNFQKLLRVQ